MLINLLKLLSHKHRLHSWDSIWFTLWLKKTFILITLGLPEQKSVAEILKVIMVFISNISKKIKGISILCNSNIRVPNRTRPSASLFHINSITYWRCLGRHYWVLLNQDSHTLLAVFLSKLKYYIFQLLSYLKNSYDTLLKRAVMLKYNASSWNWHNRLKWNYF